MLSPLLLLFFYLYYPTDAIVSILLLTVNTNPINRCTVTISSPAIVTTPKLLSFNSILYLHIVMDCNKLSISIYTKIVNIDK